VHAQVPVDVATYLLNEKRPDLAKLEARLKVSIVLIPNKFLETPHYSIERMKHDDERLDQVKPSYDRVTAPSQEEPYSVVHSEEGRTRRQEAVVKGVVPDTPAPIVPATIAPRPVVPAGPSLWSRILAWFTPEAQPEPVAVAAAPAATPRGARPERGDRRGRGERGSERHEPRGPKGADKTGQGRAERSERPGREQAPRKERPAAAAARPEPTDERPKRRGGRGGEGAGRPGREHRAQADGATEPRPAIEALASAPAPGGAAAGKAAAPGLADAGLPATAPPGAEAGEERRGRRRRRRGRGSERGDRAAPGMSGNAPAVEDDEEQDVGMRNAPATIGQADEVAPAAPVDAAPPAAEPVLVRAPAPQAIAVPKEAPRPRVVEAAPMAVAELLPIVESSGMKLAQTDPQKLAAAQARADSLQPPPVRVGRERPVLPPVEEAPLTQVETRGEP
jgi:ribonuclease E